MLSAFMSVKPLGNDFVNNVYCGGKWKDFNKCLVTDSNHPIKETNPFFFFHLVYSKFFIVLYLCTQEWPALQARAERVKISVLLLWLSPPHPPKGKEWGPGECFTDKIKRIRRMSERREVEYIFHVIRERWSARKKIPLQLRQLQNCCCAE